MLSKKTEDVLNEQVEEESSFNNMVQKLKMIEKAPGGLFLLDRKRGQQVFTPPTTQSGE